MKRPESLDELWSEKDLAERFGLRMGKGGHCITIGYWIKGGLKWTEKSGKRFFWESDIVDFFLKASESQNDG